VLVFLAICNSIAANSNAAVNAATRVFYALARNGLAPRPLGHVHARFRTPSTAIAWMSGFAFVLSLLLGWKWGPLVGFSLIATLAVIVVVVVYMLVCVGAILEYWVRRRAEFNPLLHLVLPIGGIVLFFFPLYYQYVKFVPTYPIKYANWVGLAWVVAGIVLAVWLSIWHPERLQDLDRVYVEDETEPAVDAAPSPA
jgi:amino acid transporter